MPACLAGPEFLLEALGGVEPEAATAGAKRSQLAMGCNGGTRRDRTNKVVANWIVLNAAGE